MSAPIEDYALLSDLHTGPLVSRNGSIDWLCFPRFDSPAVFTALLGDERNGRWQLSTLEGEVVERRYLGHSFVLETIWRCPTGMAKITDFLPPGSDRADLVRRAECLEGTVTVRHDLVMSFEYGSRTPWTRTVRSHGEQVVLAVAGPDSLQLSGPLLTPHPDAREHVDDEEGAASSHLCGDFVLAAGESRCWVLTWSPSYYRMPRPVDPDKALKHTLDIWERWADRVISPVGEQGRYEDEVVRSLLVLRALTNTETGGIVAAPTTSLPEEFGGSRNWDYRFTWLRDAAFTIQALIAHHHADGALLWRDWLLRAIAGNPASLRIMYGLAGERNQTEIQLPHLTGYQGSAPVRIGNAAADQFQADVSGEVMLALAKLHEAGQHETQYSWGMQKNLVRFCIENFDRPDWGIWEMRGDPHHFTHGRVLTWAAFDQGIRAIEEHGLDGPIDQWRDYRARLQAEIWERGFNKELNSFTQAYDNTEVDASLLQLPQTGFISYDDPAMLGTVARIEADLLQPGGLIRRYRTESGADGLTGDEGGFLICSFWLVEQYARSGRRDDAERLMDRLVGCANDLGLLAEEYDWSSRRMAGNFPQAFSHLGLIRAADALGR